MESLGTRPAEFVISRSPQMLQLLNQIIWLVAHRQDNLGGREDTCFEPKMAVFEQPRWALFLPLP
ncbi:hypothetical protein [Mesorhizobium sp. M0130]|uniref:hypothetical protein n=1 Tax=Mesorhizobium sp. M0130 TaxID=2956887 RepID=UPI00333D55F8